MFDPLSNLLCSSVWASGDGIAFTKVTDVHVNFLTQYTANSAGVQTPIVGYLRLIAVVGETSTGGTVSGGEIYLGGQNGVIYHTPVPRSASPSRGNHQRQPRQLEEVAHGRVTVPGYSPGDGHPQPTHPGKEDTRDEHPERAPPSAGAAVAADDHGACGPRSRAGRGRVPARGRPRTARLCTGTRIPAALCLAAPPRHHRQWQRCGRTRGVTW